MILPQRIAKKQDRALKREESQPPARWENAEKYIFCFNKFLVYFGVKFTFLRKGLIMRRTQKLSSCKELYIFRNY